VMSAFLVAMVAAIALAKPVVSEGLTLKMLIVNDHERVSAYNGDLDALHEDSEAVFEEAARKFSLLDPDITWVIAKQVDFVDSDPYTPETVGYDPIVGWTGNPSIGTKYQSLHTEFNKWLVDNEDSLPAFDVAQLFSMRNFENYVEGWASEDTQVPYTGAGGKAAGTVCKLGHNGALSMVYKEREGGWKGLEIDISSTNVVHETVHMFGALHDGANGCSATDANGVGTFMNPSYVQPVSWSSCSVAALERNVPTFDCLGTPLSVLPGDGSDDASDDAPTLVPAASAVACVLAILVYA